MSRLNGWSTWSVGEVYEKLKELMVLLTDLVWLGRYFRPR